ncbi:MAG TPA: hypothetical protein VMD74_03190 [Candidatus Methylomirabilis sp.]|nr:hypothetical protein [Candidatus Methylomirabilis sp.]
MPGEYKKRKFPYRVLQKKFHDWADEKGIPTAKRNNDAYWKFRVSLHVVEGDMCPSDLKSYAMFQRHKDFFRPPKSSAKVKLPVAEEKKAKEALVFFPDLAEGIYKIFSSQAEDLYYKECPPALKKKIAAFLEEKDTGFFAKLVMERDKLKEQLAELREEKKKRADKEKTSGKKTFVAGYGRVADATFGNGKVKFNGDCLTIIGLPSKKAQEAAFAKREGIYVKFGDRYYYGPKIFVQFLVENGIMNPETKRWRRKRYLKRLKEIKKGEVRPFYPENPGKVYGQDWFTKSFPD